MAATSSNEVADDPIQSTGKERLPEDIVYSILANLPVKKLLQFSCVSKRWCETIQSRRFNLDRSMLQQLRTSVENPSVSNIIQCYTYMNKTRSICLTGTTHRIWGDSFEPQESFNIKLPFGLEKNVPKADRFCVSELSCDGLLCVVYKSSICAFEWQHQIYLWNPYARKCRSVEWPEEFKDDCFGDNIFVGFGYDSSINDYKIVVMKAPTTTFGKCQVRVNVLKSDNKKKSAWRKVDQSLSLPHNLVQTQAFRPVTVEGDIYWLGKVKSDNSRYVLKFNIVNEKLTTISLPLEIIENLSSQIPNPELEKYGGSGRQKRIKLGHRCNKCLYLYHYNAYPGIPLGSAAMEIWKYSSKDGQGFRKVLSIDETVISDCGLIRPFGFTAKGDFIISCCSEESLAAYIPQQGKLEHSEIKEHKFWPKKANRIGYAFVDTETLVVP